ncbi:MULTISPECIES: aldehyde dehydrogenase family protein [unclassified Cupriavidus]|uniref:aldehyde dehydrogenase family protein n=1 Tax=unclassified Cupriavidus TaxID=2640874 RepID=UPI001AE26188|nr:MULTISPECIES: aldehyde dehydrogenase family protein [unclassified Cupriavidus]MBP0631158.1 aldehyde dehydrogenase family protein [Cupriavidus sp. AcVe19-1a]MBP0638552.1 aldehyde dehydrogenase family protein [Cupriavidus sp. AcVe19-6a]
MHRNYIGGEWVESHNARRNENPSDLDDVIGDFAQADVDQTELAISMARDAQPIWANAGIQARASALDFIGAELLARSADLGELLSREEGKTLAEGIAEVSRAGQIFKFFAGEALRMRGDSVDSVRPGIDVEMRREPLGVVGIITPWNFPIAIPAWKIAPALAYGNSVVFKPAELVPASAWALAEIISRSGVVNGAFNLVMGRGSIVGETLSNSRKIAGLTFTGSTETGKRLLTRASEGMTRIQLEMGGKNPLVVLDDADLDNAVDCAIQGAFFSTGQRCTATSRIIVERSVHDRFVERLKNAMRALRVGHALDPQTHLGPAADESQLRTDLEYVEIGKAEGATLALGGELLKRETRGHFIRPALFTHATPDMRIAREEIFGPVACTLVADDFEHAMVLANDSPFGLTAGICTTSLAKATHFKRNIQSGMAMVNVPTAGVDYHVSFGGTKASSYGAREQGHHAKEFFTKTKTAYTYAL